jgi:hypothetical protein
MSALHSDAASVHTGLSVSKTCLLGCPHAQRISLGEAKILRVTSGVPYRNLWRMLYDTIPGTRRRWSVGACTNWRVPKLIDCGDRALIIGISGQARTDSIRNNFPEISLRCVCRFWRQDATLLPAECLLTGQAKQQLAFASSCSRP